jgi:hypothetical protein
MLTCWNVQDLADRGDHSHLVVLKVSLGSRQKCGRLVLIKKTTVTGVYSPSLTADRHITSCKGAFYAKQHMLVSIHAITYNMGGSTSGLRPTRKQDHQVLFCHITYLVREQ